MKNQDKNSFDAMMKRINREVDELPLDKQVEFYRQAIQFVEALMRSKDLEAIQAMLDTPVAETQRYIIVTDESGQHKVFDRFEETFVRIPRGNNDQE